MKASKKIVGIDAGYVNFAVCAIDTANVDHPYYWMCRPLFKGDFSEEKLVNAVYAWINSPEIKKLLDEADEIMLERQMTTRFQAINHCVRFLHFAKTKEVNPKTLAAFFKLPTKRRAKKKAAVDLVSSKVVFPIKTGKKDDLADSYLLALYPALIEGLVKNQTWVEAEPKTKKQKILSLV